MRICISDACGNSGQKQITMLLGRFCRIAYSLELEAVFSCAQPRLCSGRQNVFGAEDELRVAPKSAKKTLLWF